MTVEIIGAVDDRGVRCLKSLVSDGLVQSAWYGAETHSTNTSAIEDLRRGSIETDQLPRIYLADLQIAGRGRQGRTWISDEKNLAFSIAFHIDPMQESLMGCQSIAVGVAIAEAIEHEFAPIQTRLKWPNDVWIDGGKFGGILIERTSTVADCIVVGVGLNIGGAPSRQEINSSVTAQSLSNSLERRISKWEVLDAVVRRLVEVQQELKIDPAQVMASFRRRCMLTGKEISFQHGGSTCVGVCNGVDDSGSLLVEQGGNTKSVTSGEATLIRRSHPGI